MLELKKVGVKIGKEKIIKDIDFVVGKNEKIAILGPNGAGKTTLLKSIGGIIPFEGSLTWEGKEMASLPPLESAKKIGYLSQMPPLYLRYSIFDYVLLGRFPYLKNSIFGKKPTKKDDELVEGWLKKFNLWELRDLTLDSLSGGQQQKVHLLQVLVQEPQILLLDEPANHLDLTHQMDLLNILKAWEGIVIGVFHDINLALALGGRQVFMKEGRLVGEGLCAQLLENVYGMDIASYMYSNVKTWKTVCGEEK